LFAKKLTSGVGAESWGIGPFTNTLEYRSLSRLLVFAGSNLRITLATSKGWCSPALPTNV
jgi:hypothetical protein